MMEFETWPLVDFLVNLFLCVSLITLILFIVFSILVLIIKCNNEIKAEELEKDWANKSQKEE